MENKDVFENAEEVLEAQESPEMEDVEPVEDIALTEQTIKPIINSKSEKEREEETGVKKVMDGTTLTVKKVEITPPKTKKLEDGKLLPIEPKVTQASKAKYYSGKLRVWYEEDNLVEYYPSVSFWVNDGVVDPNVKLDKYGNSKVAQMCRLILQKMSNNKFELEKRTINDRETLVPTKKTEKDFINFAREVSDEKILKYMVGKKVVVKTVEGNYNGSHWFRNDWEKIL